MLYLRNVAMAATDVMQRYISWLQIQAAEPMPRDSPPLRRLASDMPLRPLLFSPSGARTSHVA